MLVLFYGNVAKSGKRTQQSHQQGGGGGGGRVEGIN